MQAESLGILALLLGLVAGAVALGIGVFMARRALARAAADAETLVRDARHEADARAKEIAVAAHERALGLQEEADRREREMDERESRVDERMRNVDRQTSELGRERKALEQTRAELARRDAALIEKEARARQHLDEAREVLESNAGMTAQQARDELISRIEQSTRADCARLVRKIEDEARESSERQAVNLMVQAAQRVNIRDVMESTVSFIELPSDEMKGRIIGREGRNIRALEMATGIDLIVDDTPRSILISSFDPTRREVARVAIARLVEDGRIHPARIEEVVQKAAEDLESLIEERGAEAAYGLGISDLHPRLVRLVGRMRYHTDHGQNMLQHCLETAQIAAHMAHETGARADVVQRAGLLHEVARVDENVTEHPITASADLCSKYDESEQVIEAIRCLHPGAEPRTIEALLLEAANRMSENRPGARKENLAVFIERLRRLEGIAIGFPGVSKAYAIKSGKEIRVIVDAARASDQATYELSKQIAKTLEKELSYPGQIKVSVVRETRAVRYAV